MRILNSLYWPFFFPPNPGKAAILVALRANSDHSLSGGATSFFFLTESDHLSVNLKIATIFVIDIINLVCVNVSSPFLALRLLPSLPPNSLLWHRNALCKTRIFPAEAQSTGVHSARCTHCQPVAVHLCHCCLQEQIPCSGAQLVLEHLPTRLLRGWTRKGDVRKPTGLGVTLTTKTAVTDGCVGLAMHWEEGGG